MKKIITLSAVAFALTIIACNNSATDSKQQSNAIDTTKMKTGETFYQCPMHPEEMSDKQSSCSKCGMNLEKVEKK
jgi:uncharacterized lipoprotein NlpE involved in copper resistance